MNNVTGETAFQENTEDGFLDNSFAVLQPKKGAHRAGLDAVLLAACVAADEQGLVADLGAGTGVAGIAVAQRCKAARVEMFENDPASVRLLRETVSLARNAHLADRLVVTEADVTTLDGPRFSHIIANPPFNMGGRQASPHQRRAAAHMATDGLLKEWVDAAARICLPGGQLTMILRPDNLPDIRETMIGKFGDRSVLPIAAKSGKAPLRVIITARRAADDGERELPLLILHEKDGAFTDQVEDILRGRTGLDLLEIPG